jgi:hypothetical protein
MMLVLSVVCARRSDKSGIAEAFHVNGPEHRLLVLAPKDDIRPPTFQPIVRTDEDAAARDP